MRVVSYLLCIFSLCVFELHATSYLVSYGMLFTISSDREELPAYVCELVVNICTRHNVDVLEFEHAAPEAILKWSDKLEPFSLIGSVKLEINPTALVHYTPQELSAHLATVIRGRFTDTLEMIMILAIAPLQRFIFLKSSISQGCLLGLGLVPLEFCALARAVERYNDYKSAEAIDDFPGCLAYLKKRATLDGGEAEQSGILKRFFSRFYRLIPTWKQRAESLQRSHKLLHSGSTVEQQKHNGDIDVI